MSSLSIESVKTSIRPYYFDHGFIQAYYKEAIKQYLINIGGNYCENSMSRFPNILQFLGKIKKSYRLRQAVGDSRWLYNLIDGFARWMEGPIVTPSSFFKMAVGQYVFVAAEGIEGRVCIDVHDSGEIRSPELLQWCDIYFKTNFWTNSHYLPKVLPMVNGNPIAIGNLAFLRSLQNVEKEYDICFIVRIYTEVYDEDQIEHNIRLLEAISRTNCRKYLFAYLTGGRTKEISLRLDRQKIAWSTAPMPLHKLWQISAGSRLAVIRLGIYYCIPWRMTDMLAMGACPVLESPPFTIWPKPLLENTNFLTFGLDIGPNKAVAGEGGYTEIPSKVLTWLSDKSLIDGIRKENIEYFDNHIAPEKLGKYIIETIENKMQTQG